MPSCLRPVAYGLPAVWGWALALGLTFAAGQASAQLDVLNELYGSGVHAFNSGAYREAYDDLSMAIRNGSKDPRVYYYRGLAYLRLGRPQEARLDFQKGAALEMGDIDHFYPVSKSLERVQGQARAQIERYRSNARLVAFQARERGRFERYQRIRKNEPNVLMAPEEATEIPTPPKPAEAEEPAEAKPADEAPEPEMKEDEPAEEMPAEKPEADENDPFAEKEKEADEMPAEKDDSAEGDDEKKPAEEVTEEGDGEMADEAEDKSDAKKPADEEKDPFAE